MNDELEAEAKGKKTKKLGRSRIDDACRDLDKSWHSGMDEDLKTKTVEEIFDLLVPRSSLKNKKATLPKKSKMAKDE